MLTGRHCLLGLPWPLGLVGEGYPSGSRHNQNTGHILKHWGFNSGSHVGSAAGGLSRETQEVCECPFLKPRISFGYNCKKTDQWQSLRPGFMGKPLYPMPTWESMEGS